MRKVIECVERIGRHPMEVLFFLSANLRKFHKMAMSHIFSSPAERKRNKCTELFNSQHKLAAYMSTLAQFMSLCHIFKGEDSVKMYFKLIGIKQFSHLGHLLTGR